MIVAPSPITLAFAFPLYTELNEGAAALFQIKMVGTVLAVIPIVVVPVVFVVIALTRPFFTPLFLPVLRWSHSTEREGSHESSREKHGTDVSMDLVHLMFLLAQCPRQHERCTQDQCRASHIHCLSNRAQG